MKIAVFYNLPFGGAKRVVYEHVKNLKSLGNDVDVYTTDRQNDFFDPGLVANKEFRYISSPLNINIPFIGKLKKDYDVFYSLREVHKKIASDIDSREYDVALIHPDSITQSPYILKYLSKTPSVYFCEEPVRVVYEYSLRLPDETRLINKTYEDFYRRMLKKIDRENARSSDHIVANSFFGRERIIEAYDMYPRISNLGVDAKIFRPLNLKKKKQILFLAEKQDLIYGFDLAEKALKLIPEKIRPKLVTFSGVASKNDRVGDEEIVKIYNQSLLSLSLSKFDTFGLVPLESMACAIPVVALQVAGYRETIVDGETGLLADFDEKDIAGKILKIIEDPVYSKSMGEKGRQLVEKKWDWQKQIKTLNAILQNAAKN